MTKENKRVAFYLHKKYQSSLELLKHCINIIGVFWDVREFFSDLFSHLGWQQQRNNQRHFGRSVYYGVVQIVNCPFFVYKVQSQMVADPEWWQKMDAIKDLFIPGSGHDEVMKSLK